MRRVSILFQRQAEGCLLIGGKHREPRVSPRVSPLFNLSQAISTFRTFEPSRKRFLSHILCSEKERRMPSNGNSSAAPAIGGMIPKQRNR